MEWRSVRYFANWKEKAFAVGLVCVGYEELEEVKGIGRHADGDLFVLLTGPTTHLTATGAHLFSSFYAD